MKQCFKCEETKPHSEFYKHPKMADGYLGKCKTCTKNDVANREHVNRQDPNWVLSERKRHRNKAMRARTRGMDYTPSSEQKRKASIAYREKHPEKYRAKIMSQRIPVQPCEVCGAEKVERHHDDYSKPMEVRFLCSKHHAEHHVKEREKLLLAV